MISVTKVKVTNDLKYAKIYISILNSKDEKATIDGLKKSAGFIRTELAKRVNLRNTPELIFEKDDSIEYGAKIDSILKDIMQELGFWGQGSKSIYKTRCFFDPVPRNTY